MYRPRRPAPSARMRKHPFTKEVYGSRYAGPPGSTTGDPGIGGSMSSYRQIACALSGSVIFFGVLESWCLVASC